MEYFLAKISLYVVHVFVTCYHQFSIVCSDDSAEIMYYFIPTKLSHIINWAKNKSLLKSTIKPDPM